MLERPIISERENATNLLRDYIRDGDYTPGDRLPPERELTGSLGIGRTLLRRALEALENEGAIWRHVGKGTFVASTGSTSGSIHQLSQHVSPVDMMRARLALEPAIAREAAINATDQAVAALRQAQHACQSATTWDAYEERDDAFHRSVAEATGNALLLSLFDQLNQVRRAVAWNAVVRGTARPAPDHPSFTQHTEIIAAIEARNPKLAQTAMRTHLGSVMARLFAED